MDKYQIRSTHQQRSSASRMAASADRALTAAKVEFAERFAPRGLPAFAVESAETAVRRAAGALGERLRPEVTGTQEAATFAARIRIIGANASSLAREPADILERFEEAIAGLVDTAKAAPRALMQGLIDVYGVDLGPPAPTTTATRKRERANQLALTAALRRIAAIEAVRLAPRVPYVSIKEAITARDRVAGLLEEQAGFAGDIASLALLTLRSELLHAVPGGAAFPREVTINVKGSIPVEVLAYQLYGSVDLAADIIARNGIRHPGFVSGELKVIEPTRKA